MNTEQANSSQKIQLKIAAEQRAREQELARLQHALELKKWNEQLQRWNELARVMREEVTHEAREHVRLRVMIEREKDPPHANGVDLEKDFETLAEEQPLDTAGH